MSTRAEKRRANVAAAKESRQKLIAFGGLGVLAILLVIQGPRMLELFGGSSAPTAAALPVTPAVSAPPDRKNAPGRALLFEASSNDPFAAGSLADNDPRAGAVVGGPGGTHDPFVSSGASSAGGSASAPKPVAQPLPKRIVIGTPMPNAVAKRGWIVVLASIKTRVGRRYAETFATRVRLTGLTPVAVLDSSTRKPLRSGYYVVYTGPFATLGEVQRSAAHVHDQGYRTAYIREILRY